ITINRPKMLNALNFHSVEEIADAVERVAQDDEVRVLVITGAGDAFSSGGEMKVIGLYGKPPFEIIKNIEGHFQKMTKVVKELEKPVIASIPGPAVGSGFDLALACDIRIASEKARFGEVWIRLGIIPATGGLYLLPQLIGMAKTNELCMTGDVIDAQEAYRIGLINKLVPSDQLQAVTREMAEKLADKPAPVLAAIKRGVQRAYPSSLEEQTDWAGYVQAACMNSPYYKEGLEALAEKRRPKFREMK
ncbi:MAG: enoyl-CoA hydratase/isomerase family protein, partial [Chloroflexi bacterium]|nr:enoyl-CoA hydratase/isomerase family protein [Chloroflexota bacterium]